MRITQRKIKTIPNLDTITNYYKEAKEKWISTDINLKTFDHYNPIIEFNETITKTFEGVKYA